MDHVDQIDARIVGVGEELTVGHQGLVIVDKDVMVMAAQDVEMRRHMDEVARVGRDLSQPVSRAQPQLWEG
jgi:hypothetical protein